MRMRALLATSVLGFAVLCGAAYGQSFQGPATINQPTTPGDCVKIDATGQNHLADAGSSCSAGGVGSVTNSDGTLTISPTTGAVIASLNLANANTWLAAQSFDSSDLILNGSSSGSVTLNAPATGGGTLTLPAGTTTLAGLGTAQTFTAAQLVSGASFGLTGNQSASGIFGTSGIRYKNVAGTLNDTTASGTLATNYDSVFGGSTLTANNAVTITNDFGSYFNAPICSTNVTCTNNYALGAASVNIGGTTINSSGAFNGASGQNVQSGAGFIAGASNTFKWAGRAGLASAADASVTLTNNAGSVNTILSYPASAQLQFGAADVAGSPVAQTLSVQSASSVSNTNGANTTIDLSAGTGTGTGGTLTINGAPHSTTGSTKNTYTAVLTLNGDTGAFGLPMLPASTAADVLCYASSTGAVTYETTGTTCAVSALRFKTDIDYLSPAKMLDEVLGMKPVSFRYKPGVDDGGAEVHYGLIAEDVQKVAPELVSYEKDGETHGVKYGDGELQSHLIGAIKAQQAEIVALTKSVKTLVAANDNLTRQVRDLQEKRFLTHKIKFASQVRS